MQTQASAFFLAGVESLVMQIYPTNAAAKAVAPNTGHPHLGLWLASGSTKPLIITIQPSWFADGSAFYTYVPGVLQLCRQCFATSQHVQPLAGLVQDCPAVYIEVHFNCQTAANVLAGGALSAAAGRKLLQVRDPPAGGVKGSGCGSWCYGR